MPTLRQIELISIEETEQDQFGSILANVITDPARANHGPPGTSPCRFIGCTGSASTMPLCQAQESLIVMCSPRGPRTLSTTRWIGCLAASKAPIFPRHLVMSHLPRGHRSPLRREHRRSSGDSVGFGRMVGCHDS